ncbi:MAG TPA: acetyltransferase [Phycisphaerae bacterium]|nr:acetyltransferase [Phycisphaerae bacterium]
MSTRVLILGARTLAVDVMDLIGEIPGCEVAGFVENMDRTACEKPLEGYPVYWVDELKRLAKDHVGVCALSTTKRRMFVEQAESLGLKFGTFVHPTARVSRRAALGEGVFVSAMATVATHATLGKCVFVNRGALIGHHTTIGDYCTIQPGANLAGAIRMGAQTYVGMGAVVIDKMTVGSGCVVAAGAVVVADLPERVLAMGVPARVVKTGIEEK